MRKADVNKKELMEQVDKNIRNCRKCRLCDSAKNAVPGEGSINTGIVFIGEAPGEVEDETGRPFVGKAGILLEKLLKEIGYKREDIWIGNIIKHRPPQNRDPLPDEIKTCAPYLTTQLKTIDPKIVVTLGRYAMNYFYKAGKITRDHGRAIKIDDLIVFPVYHPAAALRNTNFLEPLEEDFKKIPRLLELIDEKGSDAVKGETGKKRKGQMGLGI